VTCRTELAAVQEEYVLLCREKSGVVEQLEARSRENGELKGKLETVSQSTASLSGTC
jgi:hypothetical protein